MKTLNHVVSKTAVAIVFGLAVATYAHEDQPGMMQRAAANHFEMRRPAPTTASTSSTTSTVDLTPVRGKHAMQIAESRRAVSTAPGLDVVHAPRPITASKDPDLEQKWRENAGKFQVAPLK
jgi:hypothetical protein